VDTTEAAKKPDNIGQMMSPPINWQNLRLMGRPGPAERLNACDYHWDIGTVRNRLLPIPTPYLVGVPNPSNA
jgi:hypothetical protein